MACHVPVHSNALEPFLIADLFTHCVSPTNTHTHKHTHTRTRTHAHTHTHTRPGETKTAWQSCGGLREPCGLIQFEPFWPNTT